MNNAGARMPKRNSIEKRDEKSDETDK